MIHTDSFNTVFSKKLTKMPTGQPILVDWKWLYGKTCPNPVVPWTFQHLTLDRYYFGTSTKDSPFDFGNWTLKDPTMFDLRDFLGDCEDENMDSAGGLGMTGSVDMVYSHPGACRHLHLLEWKLPSGYISTTWSTMSHPDCEQIE